MSDSNFLRRSLFSPLERHSRGFIVVLAGLTALAPLSIDSVLPAIPVFTDVLGASPAQAQRTISYFLLGFGSGFLFWGPLADRFGRRPTVLVGLSLFILATVGCAVAESMTVMNALRVLQGLSGAATSVGSRAIIRDLYDRETGARILSLTLMVMNVAPIVAPIGGGYLLAYAGWPSIFIATALVAAAVWTAYLLRIAETLDPERIRPLRVGAIAGSYWQVLSNRTCLGYAVLNSLAFSGFFAYITTSPLIFMDIYGYAENQYGFFFALTAGSLMAANITNSRLLKRFRSDQMLKAGVSILFVGGLVIGAVTIGGITDIRAFIGAVMIYVFGAGLTIPNGVAIALEPVSRLAGTASALIGTIQMLTGMVVSAIAAQTYDGTPVGMGAVMLILGIVVFLMHRLVVPSVHPGASAEP